MPWQLNPILRLHSLLSRFDFLLLHRSAYRITTLLPRPYFDALQVVVILPKQGHLQASKAQCIAHPSDMAIDLFLDPDVSAHLQAQTRVFVNAFTSRNFDPNSPVYSNMIGKDFKHLGVTLADGPSDALNFAQFLAVQKGLV
ncbi:hypothetical protein CLAFUW4_05421 [Fulvia fulva]|uniref:Uncharacterized protein n=1 Tax=Passalora fulva TaxID=5499 RepID=A0A9Q8P8I7_PASFU|nr:uncharacterized protein CLAFUR5_05568 [Fulvia fulva]KAK4624330.1 hypothetical protein CLAFUR4_05415 [Fulvia fulva]KAK4625253.1 hypothetical protein CLAFUR0_05423 [Fulvia fulva]UJO17249.1 hypothetical protein CLAFUR5_05568 [Fulvia fulva]WPV14590.1 hypothetical protein CLAFUW4_05421 [Fulvia fulva]WPV30517.1 hypothetical protein CLAFUW7_05419 [Fulvia fulva]